jgi:2-dehydropantoate 2-reductase
MTPPPALSPRLAVVGCGALGSFYGARLIRAGRTVHFLLRSDFEAVARHGVRILDAQGGFTVRPVPARDPAEIGPVDVVLIGLKTTANAAYADLLGPLVGRDTVLVTLQNGLGNEEALAGLFGAERVLGGLCFVALNRTAPGVVHHLAHGRILLGEYRRPAAERSRRIAGWFVEAGLPCDLTDDLETAHWEKLVWNIAFNGLGVAGAAGWEAVVRGSVEAGCELGPCLATDALLGDPRWEGLVRELMHETIGAARLQGLAVPESAAEHQIHLTRVMGSYRASTLIDFERGLPLEIESLFGEPLRRARAAGAPTPRLAALYAVLRELDRRRGARRVPAAAAPQ